MLFMMALSVSSNFNCFWRGSIFKIFFRGEGLEERAKTRLSFARFLFTATPRHKRLARLAFSLNGTFEDFFNDFFYGFLMIFFMAQECILEKVC